MLRSHISKLRLGSNVHQAWTARSGCRSTARIAPWIISQENSGCATVIGSRSQASWCRMTAPGGERGTMSSSKTALPQQFLDLGDEKAFTRSERQPRGGDVKDFINEASQGFAKEERRHPGVQPSPSLSKRSSRLARSRL